MHRQIGLRTGAQGRIAIPRLRRSVRAPKFEPGPAAVRPSQTPATSLERPPPLRRKPDGQPLRQSLRWNHQRGAGPRVVTHKNLWFSPASHPLPRLDRVCWPGHSSGGRASRWQGARLSSWRPLFRWPGPQQRRSLTRGRREDLQSQGLALLLGMPRLAGALDSACQHTHKEGKQHDEPHHCSVAGTPTASPEYTAELRAFRNGAGGH